MYDLFKPNPPSLSVQKYGEKKCLYLRNYE